MSKYTYIQKDGKNIYFDFDAKLDEEALRIGTSWEDYAAGAWVLLTEEQVAFRKANPDASLQEVFNMRLTPVPEPPEPPVRTPERAKAEKTSQIRMFNDSGTVNGVIFVSAAGTQELWIPAVERTGYFKAIELSKKYGRETVTFTAGGVPLQLPVDFAEAKLEEIELYAIDAQGVTDGHLFAVSQLSTVEEVDAYDYTAGYPEKITIAL
jgi:hypothetical protein